jgi:hypothetical protein
MTFWPLNAAAARALGSAAALLASQGGEGAAAVEDVEVDADDDVLELELDESRIPALAS